ncbi:hypothetical protein CDAR_550981 [Caerostris darwini]|uniref:Uncharacterized protein n=1 Tax=Caerostris darwini TaxID=1538125 RepID=A0AAV4QMP9_9ARAC|nr:hypothetical protein CDAR_550981 [Caerostris darwini]
MEGTGYVKCPSFFAFSLAFHRTLQSSSSPNLLGRSKRAINNTMWQPSNAIRARSILEMRRKSKRERERDESADPSTPYRIEAGPVVYFLLHQ